MSTMTDDVRQHLRHAVRTLLKTPGFTATALATLAICFGANLAIFAVVDAILLHPLPFPAADRLVRVFNTYPRAGVLDDGASLTNYAERRGNIAAFMALAIYRDDTAIVGETGSTEVEPVTRVSPDFFSTLGVGPVRGRAFTDEETTPQTDRVAILTDGYWRQRVAGDSNAIGRTVRVDGVAHTIVGILSPDFRFLSSKARLYVPLASNPDDRGPARRHSGSSSHMIARLQSRASIAEAQSDIDTHNAAMEVDDPIAAVIAGAGFRSVVVPLHADHVAAIRPTLVLLQAGALCLFLIGAVNLVNLLLIRASGRAREVAVRRALGASGWRLATDVMIETTVLTLAGGLLGLGVGAVGVRLIAVMGASTLPLGAQIGFDARLALAALAVAVLVGIVMAVPIAWHSLRNQATNALKSESRNSTASRAAQRIRYGFIVAQIALAFVLLSGAGLLGLSLERAMAIAPGFHAERVLSGQLSLRGSGSARLAFIDRLMEGLRRQPGVVAAGVGTNVPLTGRNIKSAVTVKGYRPAPGQSVRGHFAYGVGGNYFAALGVSLREGRLLTLSDLHGEDRVCVVDEDFARRYWPDGSAIGQRLFAGSEAGSDAEAFTIVGVVGAMKQASLTDDDAQGAVFYPYSARFSSDVFVLVRTSLPPETFAATLQRAVRAIDPELPVNDIQSMEARVSGSLADRRSPVFLASLFSAIAMLLTAIGTYGVLSYAVAQRRREIGLRMALGAQPGQVGRQFTLIGFRLLAAGTMAGAAGAWMAGRAMQSLLFHVPATHAATLGGTAAIIGAVSIAACWLPSYRASRISPMEALADE
jgi:predicted permease